MPKSPDISKNPNADPSAGPDWDVLSEPIVDDYVLPEFGKLTVALVNQDEDMKQKARFLGENKLAEELNEKHGIEKILTNLWKGRIAKSYYRQKYINAARHEMLDAESLILENNENERRHFNRDICRTFVSEIDGVIDEDAGDSRESLLDTMPELHGQIKSIVERYAAGEITDPEEAKREFNDVIEGLETDTEKFGEGHLSISNITDVAILARERYENLMTVANAVGSKLEHDDAMSRVMAGFDVMYGNRRNDRLEPKYNKVDKIVDKIESSKIGCLASPETIALATGAAMSVAEVFGKRTASTMLMAVPGLSAAAISGLKASTEFEQERFRAKFDTRYGREFNADDKRRKEIMGTLHEHHKATDIMADLKEQVKNIRELKANGASITSETEALLQSVARCKEYLDLEKSGDSVLSYSSELDAPSEQLDLLVYFSQAKDFLRDNGCDNLDDRLDEEYELMQEVIDEVEGDIDDSNARARKTKIKRIAKKAGASFAAGLFIGTAVQELSALINPNVQGIFESDAGNTYDTRLTAGRKLANLLRHRNSTVATESTTSFNANLNSNILSDTSKDFSFKEASDGTYSLIKDGKEVATGIDWDSNSGVMTEESIKLLREQGINVSESGSLTHTIEEQITSTKTHPASLSEYLEQATNRVKRAFWYNNDTPTFDQNELRCYYYTDPNSGNFGFVTGMTDTGSFHGDHQAIFSQLAEEGKIKLLISATSDTQSHPIEVVGQLLDNGQLAFVPEEGSVAAQFFDDSGQFIGKFAEVVQDLGQDTDGTNIIAPLATAVGRGFEPTNLFTTEEVVETVTKTIDIPEYLFSVTEQVVDNNASLAFDFPMIFPFVPGEKTMSASQVGRSLPPRRLNPNRNRYGYGNYNGSPDYAGESPSYSGDGPDIDVNSDVYGAPGSYEDGGYISEREALAAFGDISEKIFERKTLQLGEEVSRYSEKVRAERGDAYADDLKKSVKDSKELSSLDNKVKTIVTIPVHAPSESENIYKTLSFYAQQENIDMDSMVVLLDLNWREVEPGSKADTDLSIAKTRAEIDRARKDFPELRIATFDQAGHHGINEVATVMNDVAITAINDAISDGRMEADNDVLIIRNDADIRHMNKNYIAAYQAAARINSKTPMFTGTTWFNIDRQRRTPGFGSALTIERMNNLFGALDGRIHTAGGNFAYRATHFAAVNGYGFEEDDWTGAGSDDLKIGYRMEDIFRGAYEARMDNSGDPAAGDLMDPSTRMLARVGNATIDTDDTRYLKFYAAPNNLVTNDAYNNVPGGYGQNVLRPADMADFREFIYDRQSMNTTIAQFEREMSNFFTLEGGYSPSLRRILGWWFSTSEEVYTLNESEQDGRRIIDFKLTPTGRERYKQTLRYRMGNGYSYDDRNSMQRAITTGEWLSPLEGKVKLAA